MATALREEIANPLQTNGLEQDGTSHQDELDSQPKPLQTGHSDRLPDTSRHGRKIALDQVLAGNGPLGGVPGEACRGGSL